ncbi:MAG: hypothetical protein P1U86_12375 [Verrucomicrobiales bacterium]|nr:hypothetical protein [Verrucomicrobiales bacterium]
MSGNLPETSHGFGENPPRENYLPIPIPQRRRKRSEKPRRALASFLPEIRFPKWHFPPLTSDQRRRRKEFVQSILAALCVNLLIVGALLTIAIDPLDLNDGAFFTATISPEKNKEVEEASDSGSAGSNQVESGNPGSADITGMSPASITSLAISPVSLQIASQDLGAPSLRFGRSVAKFDFEATENEARKKMQAFVNGKGGSLANGSGKGKASGITTGTLKALFPKSKFGNGAGMAVIVDMSGSMQKINQAVDAYIEDNFPQGVTRHVNGCALNGSDDPFLRALASETSRERRTDYFFICDLRDGETGEGIGRIRNCLVLGKFPKKLHVVSFARQPGRHLAKMLDVTKGTFTYVNPYLDEQAEADE